MQILEVLRKQKPTHLAKYVVVALDEMYLKEGLVFQSSSGAVVGYQDLGDVNNILHDAERQIQSSSALKCKSVCTTESTKELLALSIADVLTAGVFLLYPFGTHLLNLRGMISTKQNYITKHLVTKLASKPFITLSKLHYST